MAIGLTMIAKGPRTRIPDFYEQDRVMRLLFPQFKRMTRKGHKGWVGQFQPNPGGSAYTVAVEYRGPKPPYVFVLDPPLEDGKHRFKRGNLCLYYHKEPGARWECNSVIALTIMPWTASWLHFHELYLETGIWFGPEIEHGESQNKEAS